MDEPDLEDVPVALLTAVSDDVPSPVHYNPVRVSIILEGDVVLNLPRLGDAFAVMFGLIYALRLDDCKLSPKLQSLKNYLMLFV